ncbi:MAG: trypsin-like serine protease [Desulfobacteraceae bacterium]|nr:trypsin-like serine protease [Desulfobacteraceae bacterium]MBC2748851.1 trypsin-like peptidase domain-containing protein [Desulfobacteraceae bacterium]
MTKSEVENTLWVRNDEAETMIDEDGNILLVKWYRIKFDTKDKTPFIYKDDRLIGWGKDYLLVSKEYIRDKIHERKTASEKNNEATRVGQRKPPIEVVEPDKDAIEPSRIEEKTPINHEVKPRNPYRLHSTGSGFFVSGDGYILTNYHVIKGASEIRISSFESPLKLMGVDNLNDLALLKINQTEKYCCVFCNFHELGENVVVAGYPYQGILSDSLNITEGIVSGLSGVGNDSRFLQITAPLQPGNSGGPLINQKGNVVGVVTAKLNALEMVKYTGSIPENVNFALKSSIITNFLQVYNVPFTITNCQTIKEIKTTQIARQSRRFVVLIENWQ